MQRYHKNLYFDSMNGLSGLIKELNGENWKISSHSLERIKERSNIESIGYFLKDLVLNVQNVFEYYKEGDFIKKVCFRIPFDGQNDLILVLSETKRILTVYFNSKEDNHKTLNPCNYTTKS